MDRAQEPLHIRRHGLSVPCDFEVSPGFAVIKPVTVNGFDRYTSQRDAAVVGPVMGSMVHGQDLPPWLSDPRTDGRRPWRTASVPSPLRMAKPNGYRAARGGPSWQASINLHSTKAA